MEEIKFDNLNELYIRLLPAFNTVKKEMNSEGIIIKEIEIWNYLKGNIWKNNKNLNLYDMVNDIFSLDKIKLLEYLNNINRKEGK